MSATRYRWESGTHKGYPSLVCFDGEVAIGCITRSITMGWMAELHMPARAKMGAIDRTQSQAIEWVEAHYERLQAERVADAMEENEDMRQRMERLGIPPDSPF